MDKILEWARAQWRADLVGGFVADLQRKEIERLFANGELPRDRFLLAYELAHHELNPASDAYKHALATYQNAA